MGASWSLAAWGPPSSACCGAPRVGVSHTCSLRAGESVFNQRPADRKRKAVAVLANVAAGEEPSAGVRMGGSLSSTSRNADARVYRIQGIWAAAVQVAPKPLSSHEELTAEQREYIAWHNARRDARRVRACSFPCQLPVAAALTRGVSPAQRKPADAGAAAEAKEAEEEDEPDTGKEKTHFHGKSEVDYAGNSWLMPPKDKKKQNDECFLPKRWVHTWSGHTKGVAAIRFFPGAGHLLLSAGMDSKVKIWDVYGSGKCMRTYMGHTQALKDICFSADGRRFVSCSFDKDVKLWDTETGKVICAVTAGKVPNCVKLHPHPDKQNTLLAGLADRRIAQWDLNTGDLTQEYDQHLSAVNALAFVDEGRRFVSSSDDKTLRVWEFGIPVVIKYIADPSMHSMPSLATHPNGQWLAAQSMDNQIVIYSTKERFRLNAKKHFAGHSNAGYACQVTFSPDGRFLLSGDGDGKLFVWDWKTSRILRTLKCHDQVCIGCEWHPLEASKVATCSWDGSIKLWD